MMNKPRGYLCAMSDSRRRTVSELLRESDREGIFHVGRLDMDTEGLLLFTDDGAYNFRLLNPDSGIKKTYHFFVLGELSDEKKARLEGEFAVGLGQRAFLSKGVGITALGRTTAVQVPWLFPDLSPLRIENSRIRDTAVSEGLITVSEGKWHQVRRTLGAVGLKTLFLERVKIGSLSLDRNLKRGEYRPLTEHEIMLSLKNEE